METKQVLIDFQKKLEKFIREEGTGQFSCIVMANDGGIAGYHYTMQTKVIKKK